MRPRIVATFAGALLVGGLIAGPVATPRAAAQTGDPPSFTVVHQTSGADATTANWHMFGQFWTPGAALTITVDPDAPQLPDVVDTTQTVDPNGYFNTGGSPSNPLASGLSPRDKVTVDDGTTAKELVIPDVTITHIDEGADTITGTAVPGSELSVVASLRSDWGADPPVRTTRTVSADESGDWTADFSVEGPNPEDTGTFDIALETAGFAEQSNATGGVYWVGWELLPEPPAPHPIFWVNTNGDGSYAGVSGNEWVANASVTIHVNGALRATVPTDAAGQMGGPGSPNVGPVAEGDVVSASDGTSTKTLTVTSLAVSVDPGADTVSGSAPEGTRIAVGVFPSGPNQEVVANASGQWTADFAPSSAYPYDIVPGTGGNAVRSDADGDATNVAWMVPQPQPPPFILVNAQQDIVVGDGWPNLATVTLTITGRPELVTPPLQVHVDSGPRGIDFQFFPVPFDLQPGMEVSVTDGTTTRTHTALDVRAASVNTALDTVSGNGPADGAVDVSVFDQSFSLLGIRHVSAPSGEWFANFQAAGPGPDEQSTVNLTGNQYIIARTPPDPQGNASYGGIMPSGPPSMLGLMVFPQVAGFVDQGSIFGSSGWPHGETVALTIDDPATTDDPDWSGTSVVNEPCPPGPCGPGSGQFGKLISYVIKAGDVVTATVVGNPAITVTHIVQPLSLTEIDYDADTVTGTAAPGRAPQVSVLINGAPATSRSPIPDAEGNWTADFSDGSGPGDPPSGPPGTLSATNLMTPSGFNEAGTMELPELDGYVAAGEYTLDYTRYPGTPDYALGPFSFTAEGVTVSGEIASTDYVTCAKEPTSLLCMDVVIGPLSVSGGGPLASLDGESLTLRRDIFGGGSTRTVTGTVEFGDNLPGGDPAYDLTPTDTIVIFASNPAPGPGTTAIVIAPPQQPRAPVFYLSTAPSGPVAADVNGFQWAPNTLVTIEVDGTARSPDATAFTGPSGYFSTSGSTVVVEVGDVVTVSDGYSTKTQVVPPLTVTEVDVGNDTVSGTADPDGLEPFVQVEPGPSPLAETTASMTGGDWTADFSPASADPYDIVAGTWGIAFQYDDDGDATAIRWVAADDGDGVDEPAGYDGNGDGTPDAQQANVTSLENAVDQRLVTIASPPGTSLTNVAAIDPSTLPADGRPSLDRLPIGVLSFEVHVEDEGDAADVVLYLPAGVTVDAYFKVHDAWAQFMDVTFAGSEVTLHLVDGGAGDGDETANTVIVDPGAPADVFDFAGFFAPVNNLPVRNSVKAGKAIPVKFSLGGDQGLDIFADGSPTSRSIDCNSQAPTDEIETTIESPGTSRLTYDAGSDRYQLVWKTDKAWRGCRQLTLELTDGTTHRAVFEFT